MPHITVRTDAGSLAAQCGCAVDGVRAADARKSQSSRMYLTLRAEPRSGGEPRPIPSLCLSTASR